MTTRERLQIGHMRKRYQVREEKPMKSVNWSQVLVFVLIVLVVFGLGITVLGFFFGGGYGMMGPRMTDPGGMWGWWPHSWGAIPLGGRLFGLLLFCLLPLGVLVGLILLGVWLFSNRGQDTTPATSETCPNCGKPVQSNWRNCPYCAEEL
jgi:hypothetical protein